MGLRIKIIIMVGLFTYTTWAQPANTKSTYTGLCNNLTIKEALEYLSNISGYRFAYTSLSVDDNIRVNIHFEQVTIDGIMDQLCLNTGLNYRIIGKQVLLRKDNSVVEKILISGTIYKEDNNTPVSYASIALPGKNIGVVSDINGQFELEISGDYKNDSLVISSVGYESQEIDINSFFPHNGRTIILKEKKYEIPVVYINSKDFKKITVGNSKNNSSGSLYMDTNGQQAALYVENEKDIEGVILTLNYYLSSEGNTEAPFRVRLYAVDSTSESPGADLINDQIIVKPDIKKGWYSVNIRKYNIKVPEKGFFIAMEGLFPNDYDFYVGDDDFIDLTSGDQVIDDEDDFTTITYGQRLGYSRIKKNKNCTWHYSLSRTWFQLKKQPFGIMVSADIQIRKNKEKKEKKK